MGLPLTAASRRWRTASASTSRARTARCCCPPQGEGAERAAAHGQHRVPPAARRRSPPRHRLPWAFARARTPSCGRWRCSWPRRRDHRRGAGDRPAQSVRAPHRAHGGRRTIGVSSESIGDAFDEDGHHLGKPTSSIRAVEPAAPAGADVFDRPTPSSRLRRRRAAAASVSFASAGPTRSRRRPRLLDRTEQPLAPRRATFARVAVGDAADGTRRRPRRRHVLSRRRTPYTGEDVVEISAHGSPVVLACDLVRAMRARRAPRRARRVHAARVPQRQARSGAGGGGRRSDRCGHAAAGAGRVRSTGRHVDDARSPRSSERCSI